MLRMFYFSGTGNARNVARWMVGFWLERGCQAEAVDIAGIDVASVQIRPDDEIGLASPTHGFNFPPITLAFLFGFPRATARNRVFIINTRGGVRLFGLYVPGLSGITQLPCPNRAIETAHGFVVGLLVTFELAASALIYPGVRRLALMVAGAGVAATLVRFVVESVLMLTVVFVAYWLLHRGLRVRVVERLVVLTSLTHFAFWRRYRAPEPRQASAPTGPAA